MRKTTLTKSSDISTEINVLCPVVRFFRTARTWTGLYRRVILHHLPFIGKIPFIKTG
jgi:hypothetical protein